MDDVLQQRLNVFQDMADMPDGIVDFVGAELATLEQEHVVTDETAGMLVSHFVMALRRMVLGEPDIVPPAAEVYQQIADEAPSAVHDAARLSERCEAALGVALSETEQQYLSFHLATLALTASKASTQASPTIEELT